MFLVCRDIERSLDLFTFFLYSLSKIAVKVKVQNDVDTNTWQLLYLMNELYYKCASTIAFVQVSQTTYSRTYYKFSVLTLRFGL